MSKVVIGIHGLGNKPPSEVLYEHGWKDAMREGIEKNEGVENKEFDFEGVYWANKNYPNPDANADIYRPAKEGSLKAYDEGALDEIVQSVEKAGGKVVDWFKETLKLKKAADHILEEKLPDLHRYYEEAGKFDELTQLLAEKIVEHSNKRIMLVGHSMGSIIAYDTLRLLGRQNPNVFIDHFVTIGSPLGMPHVIMKMCEIHGKPRTPTNVKRWSNFADRRDPVALDEHLVDDYKPNASKVRVKDDLVLNDWRVNDGIDIYHKSYGYLRTPEFSNVLAEFI